MVEANVVYLVWPPMGLEPVERFAASYLAHGAGIEHRLVLALKGHAPQPFMERLAALQRELRAQTVELQATGRDLDSYRTVAEGLGAGTVCFLNTSSEVLCDDWLVALHAALVRPGTGMVGCTGSFESALSAAPRPLRPFLHRRYPPFPNPHLRTNAFALHTALLAELDWPIGRGKRGALELESGLRSLSRQVWSRELLVLVAGRDGSVHKPEQWPESRTFRSGTQQNLIVADNRTRQYDLADESGRAKLTAYAWGTPTDSSRKTVSQRPPTRQP